MKKLLLTIIVTLSVIFSNASEGPYSIMGFFYYKNGGLTPLDHVKVVLLQNGQPVDSTLTSNTGFYLFSGLADNTYIIEGYCTKPWGSVNGTDALKIERQFTGIDTITLPVILNAADVNNSGSVNGTDAVKTKRRFVGMDNSFLRGNWTFAKPAGGNSVTLSGGSIRQDFYGLCVGDVNGSNIPLPTQELPTVRTVDASAITQYAATSGGNVFSDGGQEVTDRGVCWSVSQNPTTADPHTSDGNGMGVFSSSLSGLTPGTLYYLRAYANNSLGTGYGNQVSFSTAPPFACGQTLTDMRDGSNYSTVTIGTQCWMAQNMNIGNRIYSADAQTNHAAIEKYCYNNLDTNCSVYGGLYQWDNTVQWESPSIKQGICPSGWHVPSDAEWSALANFLGGPAAAGGKLKESGFLHWADPNTDATNTSGFTALPGGSRSYYMSPFEDMNQAAYFWTSSRDYDSIAWFRKLSYDNGSLMRISDGFKTYGFSVRCIKGGIPTIITASIIDILHLTATGGGNIISDGENTITGRGICWNTTGNPVIAESHTMDGTGIGTFTSLLTGLTAGTVYYVRAYASNSSGTSYGNEVTFTTPGNPIVLTTSLVTDISQNTASGGGNVISDGGIPVIAKGICWSPISAPTLSDSHTVDGNGTGSFIGNLTGLSPSTLYYVRAYATNNVGTVYGNEVSFSTFWPYCIGFPTIEYEGKTYNTIQVGGQCWFKDNLNVGIRINTTQNQANNGIKEKFCVDDVESNCDIYGGLYNWNESMQYTNTQGAQGLCPDGWHVPTDGDWTVLTDFLGGAGPAGAKMKEAGLSHWASPNAGATNESGFSALPGGGGSLQGGYYFTGYYGYFWSSTEAYPNLAWHIYLGYYNQYLVRTTYDDKTARYSIRCLKDN